MAEAPASTGTPTGTERIAAAFAAARAERRAALMPYMMGGFPDAASAEAVASAYAEAGADLIELGVPFSDPLADGPVIHDAATRALARGATFESVLATCERVGRRVPTIPMVYANMMLSRDAPELAAQLAEAGAAGVIVPDLPPEEAAGLDAALEARGLALVPLVAPNTPATRRAMICGQARGFVYVVSDTRVTGERESLPESLPDLVAAVREEATVPAAVGFGIASPEQAAAVGRVADGVIIGSRLVRVVAAGGAEAAQAAFEFLRATREALLAP